MTHISRKKLPLSIEKVMAEALNSIFTNLHTKDTQKVFSTLMTKTEKVMLYKRLGIIHLLKEGNTVDEISKVMATTRQTVDRIRLQLVEVPAENKKALLRKLNSWKRINVFKAAIKEILDQNASRSKIIHNKRYN